MKLRTTLALLLLLIAGVFSASAQNVGSAIVTAQAAFSLNPGDVLTLTAQITSCGVGQLPIYNGTPISNTPNQTTTAPFTANSSQIVGFVVPGNDKIQCGLQYYSLYALTWKINGFPAAPTQTYRFVDATNVALSTLTPINFIPPVIAPGAGSQCSQLLNQVLAGFNAQYMPVCYTPTNFASGVPNLFGVGVGSGLYSTITAAIAAAGTTGAVYIAPNFQQASTDTPVNLHNVHIDDNRGYNPSNSLTYDGHSPMPKTTIKAADYGALCNGDGVHDDTAAIQAALNANTAIIGSAGGGTNFMGAGAVELPQGRCQVSSTLKSIDYGSVIGSPGGSWIFPLEPWLGGSNGDLLEITTSYSPNGPNGTAHGGGFNRQVRGIGFEYNYFLTAHTAINVISGYGHSPTTPYSASQNNPQSYQINNVTITDNYIALMDTGVALTDCGDCNVYNNWITNVRTGISSFNSYGTGTFANTLIGGTSNFTPVKTASSGVYTSSISLSYCNGGTGSACIGGTLQNIVGSPQGFGVGGTIVESGWGTAGNFPQLLGLTIHNSCMCDSTVAMHLGNIYGPQITDSSFSTRDATSSAVAITIDPAAGTPGSGEVVDNGWTFINNTVSTDNNSAGTATGILLGTGVYPLVNLVATGNHFFGFNHSMVFNAPLINSVLTNNYGDGNAGSLMVFNATGGSSFANTVVHDNTSRDPYKIVDVQAGGGLVIGYNSGGNQFIGGQLTGTQIASGAGCTTGSTAGVGILCPLTVPNTFFGTTYNVLGCSIIGASAQVHTGLIVKTNGLQFSVYEIPDTNTAASGGTIYCQVNNTQ